MTLFLLSRLALAQDTTAPFNTSILIAGDAAWTNTSTVSVALSAEDDTAVTQMCLSNTPTCTAWQSYATETSWSIGSTQGTRTVYARFRDAAGNTTDYVADTIGMDSSAPINGTLTSAATSTAGELTLSWTGFSDTMSGLASYTLVYSTSSTPASKCTSGTTGYTGTDTTTTLTGLTTGVTYYFRLCAVDNAGNTSTGSTATGVPKLESNAPSGTVVINGDAAYTTSTNVTLTLSATDDTGVTQMCIANSSSCSSYQSYSTTKAWTLAGTGARTVFVYFQDASGNVSAVTTDTITVDTTRPTNGAVSASVADRSVELSWSGFTDPTSGIASYKVVQGTTSAPSSCSTGTLVYSGASTSVTVTGLSNGTTYGFRVCAIDNAGNTSTGATITAKPASELDPPTNGAVVINDGAAWARTTSVSLTLAADDASGISRACVANTTACAGWTSFAATRTWTLGGSGSARTVYAWFEDSNGNRTTSPVTDTIGIDAGRPSDGSVTGTASAISAALSWSGFSDVLSGVASYKVVYARSTTAPASCSTGTTGYTGTSTTATVTGLSDGVSYSFRVCAIDAAGNTSNGATLTLSTIDDTAPPSGSVVLNSGAAWTNNRTIQVEATASDDRSNVARWCVSTTSSACLSWEAWPSSGSATTTLSTTLGSGTLTAYAWFEDGAGNTSVTAATDTIGLDLSPPTDGSATGVAGSGSVSLSWSGYTDAGSGISSYIVAYQLDGSAPSTCDVADVRESTTSTTRVVTGLTTLPYTFRVCAVDQASNASAGSTVTVTPL